MLAYLLTCLLEVFLAELHLEGVPGALDPDLAAAELWWGHAREMGSSQLGGWEALRGDKLSWTVRPVRDEL